MKYRIKYSGGFKKSYKLCKRRGYDIQLLEKAITLLANEGKLPPEYKAHILSGRLSGILECHIAPDWLMLWTQNDSELTLILLETGTHSDLF